MGSIEDIEAVSEGDQAEDQILAQGPPAPVGKGKPTHVYRDESGSEPEDEDEDIILEAGPVVIIKSSSSPLPPGSAQSPSSSARVPL